MQINVKFDSLEEFLKYVSLGGPANTLTLDSAPTAKNDVPCEEPQVKEPESADAPPVTAFDKAVSEARALAETEAETVSPKTESEPSKKINMADIRAIALTFSKNGRSKELREAFKQFGASKLSDVKEEDYPALMKVLGELNG